MSHQSHLPHRAIALLIAAASFLPLDAHAVSPSPEPTSTPEPTATPAPTPRGPSVVDLEAARDKLNEYEEDIKAGAKGAKALQDKLHDLTAQVADEQGTLDEVRVNLQQTATRVSSTKERLATLHRQMRERARALYMRGPGELIGVLLGADSMRDFIGRMAFANSLAKQDKDLVLQTRIREGELKKILAHQKNLEKTQASTVVSVREQQDDLIDVFARQQAILVRLAQARGNALALVASMESQLSSGEFRNLRRVVGQGMTVSYEEWARGWLEYVDAPIGRENMIVMIAWQAAEGTQATWNPLATTMRMEGATTFNDHGVKNYRSREQGYEAVVKTLHRPNYGYEKILDGIEKGADAMDTGIAINKSSWCRGCNEGQYLIGIIPAVERYYDEYSG